MGTAFAQNFDKDAPSGAAGEHRFLLEDVSWNQYLRLRTLFDDRPGIRLSYLEGSLEIMSPGPAHEFAKKTIARLLEIFFLERDLPLTGYGSTTFRRKAKERGLEPDECYVFGKAKRVPDIALEVVITSGGIDKLAIYAGLEVPEVWFWEAGQFKLYRLRKDTYQPIERSEWVPDLDFARIAEYLTWPSQHKAVKAFQKLLREP